MFSGEAMVCEIPDVGVRNIDYVLIEVYSPYSIILILSPLVLLYLNMTIVRIKDSHNLSQ